MTSVLSILKKKQTLCCVPQFYAEHFKNKESLYIYPLLEKLIYQRKIYNAYSDGFIAMKNNRQIINEIENLMENLLQS